MEKTSNMDRKLNRSERIRHYRPTIIRGLSALALVGCVVWVLWYVSEASVSRKSLTVGKADRGDINMTVNATGLIVPAFEEVLVSPVSTRLLDVLCHTGDSVEEGTPLLRLDLETTRTDYKNQTDQLEMSRLQLEKLKANNRLRQRELEMQVRISEMSVKRMRMELVNERYLDSIGGGTTEHVREVEFALNSGELELEKLRNQLRDEKSVMEADVRLKQLEISVKEQELGLARRMLDVGEIRSPRSATVTYIMTERGAQIGAGQKVAAIADLSSFRIEGELPENYGRIVQPGSHVYVRISGKNMNGRVMSIAPTSTDGQLRFTMSLDNDSTASLRPGQKPEIYVESGFRSDVVRIPNAKFYSGPGNYRLYVDKGDGILERRDVRLGEAGFDYIEVIDGIEPGESVVVAGLKASENNAKIRLTD